MHVLSVTPTRGGNANVPHKNILMRRGRTVPAETPDDRARSSGFLPAVLRTEEVEVAAIARAPGVGMRDWPAA